MSKRDYEFRKRAIAGHRRTALQAEPSPRAILNDFVFLTEVTRDGKRWVGKIEYGQWTYTLTLWPEDLTLLTAATGIDLKSMTCYRFDEALYLQVRKHSRKWGYQGIAFMLDSNGKPHRASDYQ